MRVHLCEHVHAQVRVRVRVHVHARAAYRHRRRAREGSHVHVHVHVLGMHFIAGGWMDAVGRGLNTSTPRLDT